MTNPDARRPPYQWLGGYPLAALAIGAAILSLMALDWTSPVPALMLAVIATTWFAGTKPALFAMAASLPVLFYALPPVGSFALDSYKIVRIPYFLGIGAFIIWIVASERRVAAALRRAHDALQLKNEELTLVIDTMPAMSWIIGPDGKMEFLNRRWLDYAGLSLEEALEKSSTTMHAEDAPRAFDKWTRAMAAAEPFEDEMRLRRADGVYRWFIVRTVPQFGENGRVCRWYGTSTDIEDRKRAEQALRESAERLQHLSRRLLEAHEEERRHFSRELHDEFGQLLVAIGLRLQAAKNLAGDAAQPELQKSVALLQQAVDRVRGLALELRPAMLEAAGLAATLQWLAGQHQQGTGLHIEVTGELDPVPTDVAIACFRLVQQALTNIVQHARAREVGVELDLSDAALEIAIRDDGCGFDVAKTMQTAPGSGHLGLLGMRERVEILGGRMQIDSAPGEGTRITLSVPLPRRAASPRIGVGVDFS